MAEVAGSTPAGSASSEDNANVAKLVDALGSGLSAARHKGSSPFIRTTNLFS